MKTVYALVMDSPGHYIVGHSAESIDDARDSGWIELHDAAHLMVTRGQCVLTPIDVLDAVVSHIDHYAGIGTLNVAYRATYEKWLTAHRNPPDFGVQEGE